MKKIMEKSYALFIFVCIALFFASCDMTKSEFALRSSGGESVVDNVIYNVTRNNENGIINAYREVNGVREDTTVVIPLGAVEFTITPVDTIIVGTPSVTRYNFAEVGQAIEETYEQDGVSYTKTTQVYKDTLSGYAKDITITYLDAKMILWGKEIEFPKANGGVAVVDEINVRDEGVKDNYHYYTAITQYQVFFLEGYSVQEGYEVLAINLDDELISVEKTNEGFDWIDPTTSKSWIEITSTYSISGSVVNRYEVLLYNGITAPAREIMYVSNFDLTPASPNLGVAFVAGNRTDGNFQITTYNQNYVIGNNLFNRTFVFSYEKAQTVINGQTFDMPYREYENINDGGFILSDMSSITGYDRKLYTHTIEGAFNGRYASEKAEVELRVEAQPGGDDDDDDNNNDDDRVTPSWLGNPVSAKYTRVQKTVGAKFIDMIVFEYENGVVMAPNGVVDLSLAYAFDASVAAANNVERCLKNSSFSGVWGNGKWQPAGVIETNSRWIYNGINSSWDHGVNANEAVALGIGVDVTPIPSAQSVKIDGNKITINYAVNNGSKNASSSLSLQ